MQTLSKRLGALFMFFFFVLNGFSQVQEISNPEKTVEGSKVLCIDKKSKQIKYIQLKSEYYFSQAKEDEWLQKTLHFSSQHSTSVISKSTDKKGFVHTKYQIHYKGIPVDGSVFYIHSNKGRIHSANGEFMPNASTSVTPEIKETEAFSKAIEYVRAKKYKWEIDGTFSKPNGILTLVNVDSTYILAYKFDIYAIEPLSRNYIYINAKNGTVIKTINRIHIANENGTARTMYNGTVTINTDSYNNSYRLRETTRGEGIETYNLNHSTSYSSAVDFTDLDNNWTDTVDHNHAANDAHYASEATYDYFQLKFGRNSFDDRGSKIISYVHYGHNYVNAFWDGSSMTYGDGDGVEYSPLTPIEVVAHEITHGVTEHSAGLIYSGESGALNESFSDIFGVVVDFFKNPTRANYLMGDAMSLTNTPFRSMQDPNDYFCPDTYHGQYWDPYEEVHTNSGVQNFWFYLLSEGGSGTNDLGNRYNVSGIGREKAAQIAYRNLTVYLTPSSNFEDARYYSIQSAIDLYGDCSPEVIAVTNAWYAVGVGSAYDNSVVADFSTSKSIACKLPAQIYFYNNSFKAITYKWDFGDGDDDTARNPVHTFRERGTFKVRLIAKGNTLCNNSDTIDKNIIVDQGDAPAEPDCIPRTLKPGSGGIFAFKLNTINKTTNGSAEDYRDFTCTDVTTLKEGTRYKLSGRVGDTNLENFYLWIDFNNNGSFIDPGEKVFEKRNISKTFTDSVLIPAGVTYSVPLRLRIGTDYSNQTALSSCNNSQFGQYHDYSVIIEKNNDAPVTLFNSTKQKLISGDTIQFRDLSLNLPTSWSWSFPGGNPSTSDTKNPKVSYSNPGVYDVTLTTSNANGSTSITKTGYIVVTTPAPVGLMAGLSDQELGKVSLKWYQANNDNAFEDFEDGVADNFIFSDDKFVVENGYLKAFGAGDNSWKSAGYEQVFEDFLLEYKFQQLEGFNYSVGSFVRSDGFFNKTSANGYLINVLPVGSYGVWKISNGVSTNIIPWKTSQAINTNLGSWNVVTIEGNGNKIRIFVNSQFVDEFVDDSFASGKINLVSYFGNYDNNDNFDIRWDYFNVLQDNSSSEIQYKQADNKVIDGSLDITRSPLVKSSQKSNVEVKGILPQVNSAGAGTNVFKHYKIFRDSVVIKTTTESSYTDTLPRYGRYRYFVTSLYEEGESEPTNKVNVRWEEINPGDNCSKAQNLANLTSPYTSSTVGYESDFNFCGLGSSPDRIFYIDVPRGALLKLKLVSNNYYSRHSLRTGAVCPGNIEISCMDNYNGEFAKNYLNNSDSTQRVYYVLGGYGSDFGNFTLSWDLKTPSVPGANFIASSQVVTPGTEVSFTDLSNGVPSSYNWFFPGGTPSYSTEQNPAVNYNTSGLFPVKLVVANFLGTDSVTHEGYITVSKLKYCKTGLGGDNQCPGDITEVSITGTTLNNLNHSNCNLSNESTYAFYSPQGSNKAVLKNDTTYELNVTTSRADIISVWIDYNQNSIYEPSEWTQVTTSSTANVRSKINVDIPSSALPGLTGMRIRSRKAGDSNNEYDACSSFDSGLTEDYLITIVKRVSRPVANFAVKTDVICGENVEFSDLSKGSPTHWNWTFTGGTPSGSNVSNPVVTYSSPGRYDVKLKVSNSFGSDSITRTAYINVMDANQGDDCSKAQNLSSLNSPFSSKTNGYNSSFQFCSLGNSPDRIFYIDVPNGSVLTIGQTDNNFDSRHSIRIGGTCPGTTELVCMDDPDTQIYTYSNTSGATQRIYYILGGYSSGYGNFTLEWQLNVPGKPGAAFVSNQSNIQMGSQVNFTDKSTGVPSSWRWYFENGSPSYSNTANPSVYYSIPGEHDVKLVVSNSFGVDSIVKTNFINVAFPPKPVANFNTYNNIVKTGQYVYFSDYSNNSPTKWKWYFTGGTPSESTSSYPSVSYNASGIFDVKLVVSNAGGADSITKAGYITVLPVNVPVSNFYASKTNILTTESVTFYNNSANDPTSYKWTFKGGIPETSEYSTPTVNYTSPGTYDVKLVVKNSAGADSIVKTEYITVSLPSKPVPNFVASTTTISSGSSITFRDVSSHNPTGLSWKFDGGNPSTSTYSNPTVTYSSVGTYDVKLVATNEGGKDSIVKTGFIKVLQKLPGEDCSNAQDLSALQNPFSGSTIGYKSDFNFCSFGYSPDRVFYIDVPVDKTLKIGQITNDFDSRHSIRIGGDCPGTTELVCVDDPDEQQYTYTNNTGTVQRVYYFLGGYSSGYGNFKLSWNLTSSNGDKPTPIFTSSTTDIYCGQSVYFNDQSTNSPTSIKWFFEGGNPSISTYSYPSVYYSTPGKYKVKLVVSNAHGSDSVERIDYINVSLPPKPEVSFSTSSLITTTNSAVYFNDQSNNNPTNVRWTFTGGTPATSTSRYPEVRYSTPGLYDVKLVVENQGGRDSVMKTKFITVIAQPKPIANFTTETNVQVGSYISFRDISGNSPNTWKWYFTGGSPSSSTYSNPSVVYNTPGTYDVKLVVSNSGGKDSITKAGCIKVNLPPKPKAEFYSSQTEIITGSYVGYYNYSEGSTTSFRWEFPGGSPSKSTQSNPYVYYMEPGLFNVKLVLTNPGGSDSIVKNGYVRVSLPPKPVASFISYETNIITGQYVNFYNYCTNNPTSFKWIFEGGNPSTSNSSYPSVQYTQPGVYSVKLYASNSGGVDSMVRTDYITVNLPPKPVASFNSSSQQINPLGSVSFYANYINNPTSFRWEFPGGYPSTSNSPYPSVQYFDEGFYTVKLVASNSYGADSVIREEYIRVSDEIYCTTNLGGSCPGDINTVSISGTTLNRTSGGNCNYSYSSAYFMYPPSGNSTAFLGKGRTYELSVTTSNYDRVSVWIDYNKNGSFEDSEWTQVSTYTTPNVESKVNITVPQSALNGQTMMRVRSSYYWNNIGANDACTYLSNGITEDYIVTIRQSTNFTADVLTVCDNQPVNFTNTSLDEGNVFNWDFGEGATPRNANAAGPYTVVYSTPGLKTVTLTVDGATTSKTSFIKVSRKPAVFTINTPHSFCEGKQENLNLSGSETGMNYQLYRNRIALDNFQQGTGNPLSWTISDGGNYRLKAYNVDDSLCFSQTDSIDVTVKASPRSTKTISICEGKEYTLPDNKKVSSAGEYISILPSAVGCDSIVVTKIEVKAVPKTTKTVSICQGSEYTLPDNVKVSSAGEYTSILPSAVGCDSIIVTKVEVKTIPSTAQISISQNRLVSNITEGNQWYSLENGLVTGENSDSFVPAKSGTFYNVITVDGCSSSQSNQISYIKTGINDISDGTFVLFPNPIRDNLVIKPEKEIVIEKVEIRNALGSLALVIKPEITRNQLLRIDMSQQAVGYYTVLIYANKKVYQYKIVKID